MPASVLTGTHCTLQLTSQLVNYPTVNNPTVNQVLNSPPLSDYIFANLNKKVTGKLQVVEYLLFHNIKYIRKSDVFS